MPHPFQCLGFTEGVPRNRATVPTSKGGKRAAQLVRSLSPLRGICKLGAGPAGGICWRGGGKEGQEKANRDGIDSAAGSRPLLL